ncbi:MAG: FxsA family protein [Actinomycetota bacterium]
MLGYLALLFFLVPIAEIAVLIQVGQVLGTGPTILALIGLSLFGAWLAKREGIAVWGRFTGTLAQGRMPSAEIQDGALILFGAALLLTPGFLTDFLGLSLLIPGLRSVVKPALLKAGRLAVVGRTGWSAGSRSSRRRARVIRTTVVSREDEKSDDVEH